MSVRLVVCCATEVDYRVSDLKQGLGKETPGIALRGEEEGSLPVHWQFSNPLTLGR